MLDDGTDLGLGDPRALDTHWCGGARPQVEGVTLAGERLGPVLVEDDPGVQLRGRGEGQARGDVGLDEAGDHLGNGPLGGQHQVDPGGAGQLGDALDGGLHVLGGGHHEVGELVDDDQEVGVGAQLSLGSRQGLDLACAHRLVEVVDVLEAEGGQVVVAGVHLAHHPLQGLGRLLRGGDDRGDEVGDALVDGQLHPLGVHQHHAHLLRGGTHHDRGNHRVDEGGLTRTGLPGHQQVRGLGQVGDDVVALDVLAQPDHQRVRLLARGLGAQDVTELDHLPVAVGNLDADGALTRNGGEQTDLVGGHRVGDVLLQPRDPGDVDPPAPVDLVAGDLGAARVAGDRGVHVELGEDVLQGLHNGVVGGGAGGVTRPGTEQRVIGQGVGRAVGQSHVAHGDLVGEVGLLERNLGGLLGDGVETGGRLRGRLRCAALGR